MLDNNVIEQDDAEGFGAALDLAFQGSMFRYYRAA